MEHKNKCECGGGWNGKYCGEHYNSAQHQKYEIHTYGKTGVIKKPPLKIIDYENKCECGGGWNGKYKMRVHYDSAQHQKYEINTYGKTGVIGEKKPVRIYEKKCNCGAGWNKGHKKQHLESAKHQIYLLRRNN